MTPNDSIHQSSSEPSFHPSPAAAISNQQPAASVQLGKPLALSKEFTKAQLEALIVHHGSYEAIKNATFYESATVYVKGVGEREKSVEILTRDGASHGVVMLYDVLKGGKKVFARACIKKIYTLEGSQDVWMGMLCVYFDFSNSFIFFNVLF